MRPNAPAVIHQQTDYPALKTGAALSIQIGVDHIANYYAYHPRVTRYAGANIWTRIEPSRYINRPLNRAEDYFDWMRTFAFPRDMRLTAERAAGQLAESLEHLTQRIIERDQASGRLDRYKLAEVGKAAAVGQYRDERVRPYRRTEYRDAYTPTVAIIASIETEATIYNLNYCPQLVSLALSVLWACEASGIHAHAALVQGRGPHWSMLPIGYAEVVQGFMLTSTERVIPAKAYGMFMNDDLWMHMKYNIKAATYEYAKVIASTNQARVEDGDVLRQFGTHSGGNAVHWARQILGADVVIAIGKIDDSKDAEVAFSYEFTVEQAVQKIAEKAKSL